MVVDFCLLRFTDNRVMYCTHVFPAWPRSVERVVPRNFNVVEHGFVTHNIGTYGVFNRYLR